MLVVHAVMEPAPHQANPESVEARPLAVVTPLFRGSSSAVSWSPTGRGLRRQRAWQGAAAALALVAMWSAAAYHSHRSAQRVHERLQAGCLDVQDCRALSQFAEAAKAACWVGCGEHSALAEQARSRFRTALEDEAARQRELENSAYERALAAQRAGETSLAREQHRFQLEELDRRHRYQLELLEAEAQARREEARHAAAKHLAYLRQLTPEQRLRRLTTCHKTGGPCDERASLLVEAAPLEAERKQLAETQERYLTGDTEPERPSQELSSAKTVRQERISSPLEP